MRRARRLKAAAAFELDVGFTDADGDMIAEIPTDPAQGVANQDYDAPAIANSVLTRMIARDVVGPDDLVSIHTSGTFPRLGFIRQSPRAAVAAVLAQCLRIRPDTDAPRRTPAGHLARCVTALVARPVGAR